MRYLRKCENYNNDIVGKVIIKKDIKDKLPIDQYVGDVIIMFESIIFDKNSVYFNENTLFNSTFVTRYREEDLQHPSVLLEHPEVLEYVIGARKSGFNKHFGKIYKAWMNDPEMKDILEMYEDNKELGLL